MRQKMQSGTVSIWSVVGNKWAAKRPWRQPVKVSRMWALTSALLVNWGGAIMKLHYHDWRTAKLRRSARSMRRVWRRGSEHATDATAAPRRIRKLLLLLQSESCCWWLSPAARRCGRVGRTHEPCSGRADGGDATAFETCPETSRYGNVSACDSLEFQLIDLTLKLCNNNKLCCLFIIIIIIIISLLNSHVRRTCLHNKNISNETHSYTD